jgi:hypothetical protein
MSEKKNLIQLPVDWRAYNENGVNLDFPGIYEWYIEGCGSYIGKYKRKHRPLKEYARNVQNILNGSYYRRSKPDGFRRIHRELARAHLEGRLIRLIILENVEPLRINERERELIAERGALNDPPFGRKT